MAWYDAKRDLVRYGVLYLQVVKLCTPFKKSTIQEKTEKKHNIVWKGSFDRLKTCLTYAV